MKPLVAYIIMDVHMGMGHDGLSQVVLLHRRKNPLFARYIDTKGGLVLFVNKGRTRFKLMHPDGDVLGYCRVPARLGFSEEAVRLVAKTFGGDVEVAEAVRKAFTLAPPRKFIEATRMGIRG